MASSSNGIHLAFTSALSAASSMCAPIRGHCSKVMAAEWHTSYTRFQVVVLSAYKQVGAQNVDMLSDISEDNYDRAFAFIRPVIQRASDMGSRLSDSELQRSLDFCVNLSNPTSPEQQLCSSGESKELLRHDLRVGRKKIAASHLESEDSELSSESESVNEMRMILKKINARRVVHSKYTINNFEAEPLDGYVVRLERGKLGLIAISQPTKLDRFLADFRAQQITFDLTNVLFPSHGVQR
ncbi:hypothetical protein JOM56_014485 [Amanita muscaria]